MEWPSEQAGSRGRKSEVGGRNRTGIGTIPNPQIVRAYCICWVSSGSKQEGKGNPFVPAFDPPKAAASASPTRQSLDTTADRRRAAEARSRVRLFQQ